MEPELTREYFLQGTNGTLGCNGVTICATIKLPWRKQESPYLVYR